MARFALRTVVFLGTAALGMLVVWWVLDDVTLSLPGFLTATIVFALAQSLFAPIARTVTRRYAPALLGGVGLISTFVALLVATLFPGGLQISGVTTWILATVLVWIVTALGALLLPPLMRKTKTRATEGQPGRNKT